MSDDIQFSIETINEVSNSRRKRTIKRIKPAGNNQLTIRQVRQIFETLQKKYKPEQLSITTKFIDGNMKTIKTYEDEDVRDWDEENYYKNKVKDYSKFGHFEFVDIYIKN